MFIDRITEQQHLLADKMEYLKKKENPLVLVGAGFVAKKMLAFSGLHGVTVDMVAVNEKYINDMHIINELPVSILEKIAQREENMTMSFVSPN